MESSHPYEYYDVIIVGTGVVGLIFANALARSPLRVAILDNKKSDIIPLTDQFSLKVTAINHASRNIFDHLNIWEEICKTHRVSAYEQMFVWDAVGGEHIKFDCTMIGKANLGFILESPVIQNALLQKLASYENIHLLSSVNPVSIGKCNDLMTLTTKEDHRLITKLLVGADGANSWVREEARMGLYSWSYQHCSIVTTVKIAMTHQRTAWQCFLPTGPLALLPLSDPNYCSVVWSTTLDHAHQLLHMDDASFNSAITNAFEFRLGNITKVGQAISIPLHMRHVKNYVKSRLALVGDAAHTLHPLAGQGVNLGIMDAVCLAEVILDAFHNQRDWGKYAVLRRFERWRKGDNWLMIAAMELFKRLFENSSPSIVASRKLGLQFSDRNAFIKNHFMHYALGVKGDMPKLAQTPIDTGIGTSGLYNIPNFLDKQDERNDT